MEARNNSIPRLIPSTEKPLYGPATVRAEDLPERLSQTGEQDK